jgi:RNA polymerase sigma-70 factor, ECF subfamily
MTENPVHRLNRAVAVSFFHGPINGLTALAEVADELEHYQPYQAARAHMLRRAGLLSEARLACNQAIALSQNQAEIAFLRQMQTTLLS